jgi:hypothetical protein
MSFGFGAGDAVAISRLAWNVYKSCKDAPKDFRDISGEVSCIHIVLKETEELVAAESLGLDKYTTAKSGTGMLGCSHGFGGLAQ